MGPRARSGGSRLRPGGAWTCASLDFPSETSAITSSLDALKTSVAALSASPSAAQIATVTKDAGNLVSSVTSFTNASKSKCS